MLIQAQTYALRPLTTAHLAQTMTLLELTGDELRQKIEAELAANPALELVDEHRCPSCRRPLAGPGLCPLCRQARDVSPDQPIVFVTPWNDSGPGGDYNGPAGEPAEEWRPAAEDLPTFVLRQIATELDPNDRPLAAHILTGLDEDGLLQIPLLEIAQYHHLPLSRVQKVLHLIQRAEPVGVGSPSPQQALLVQLEVLAETRRVPRLAQRAVEIGMDLLSRRAYPELAQRLGIGLAQTQDIARFIGDNLNPFPARAHWGDRTPCDDAPPVYHQPDVIIGRLANSPNSPLVVEILTPYAGALRVNPLFREVLPQMPPEKAEQWQADLERAGLLVKCLQQRSHTLVRLMQRLVVLQRGFILEGEAHLQPLTRAQLALELEVHESTISRAVAGKAVQLPNRRIVPLSMLFDRSLHIRTALRQIISSEGDQVLSDTQIAERLIAQGYPVARRTVAKYRAMEGILPARLRQPAIGVPAR